MHAIVFYIFGIPALVLFLIALRALWVQPKRNVLQLRLEQWTDWDKQQSVYERPEARQTSRRSRLNADPLFLPGLRRSLVQIKSSFNVVTFLLFVLLLMASSGTSVWWLRQEGIQSIIAAVACGSLPFFWLKYQKNRYMKNFESQLAPALDMLARSLWAGHTIQAGIRIIGQDFDDPIRSEFSKTAEAIDFGQPLPQALEELALRVDIPDLRFFVTSVLVQRETGGNLADILARTAELIRQRLEFNERIKALSAQGKLSAQVLFAIPVLITLAIRAINPDHMALLFTTDIGRIAVMISGAMMILGIIIVRHLVKIQV